MTVEMSQLTPRRPYLLRAFYEWLLDNQLTPHLVVDVTLPGVLVPMEYARDGQIVLNIAPRAVGNLELANDEVRFNARFGGEILRSRAGHRLFEVGQGHRLASIGCT